jgi:predicted ATP-grasp superfamily ATP-dependent carboligase
MIRRANDKSAVLAVAKKAGVPVPASFSPEEDEELEEVIARLRYPAIVKLRDDEGTYLEPADRYAIAETPDELREAYRKLHQVRPFPVIQEMVSGDGYGVGVLAKEGRVLASFCHRREREYPVSGGPSALCVSVRDERLAGYAAALIRELGWTGVAMVEFKKDDDYRLLEVNPRFWGSLPLATEAGVNFPHLLCRMAMGEDVKGPDYSEGIRVRFLPMDVSAAWGALGDPARRERYLSGFLRDLVDPTVKDGLLDAGDPLASIAYLLNRLT